MCHIPLTLQVYDLSVTSGGRGDGGEVNAERSAKPVIAIQDYVALLDTFQETSGECLDVFVVTKTVISSRVCGDQHRYFKQKHDVI